MSGQRTNGGPQLLPSYHLVHDGAGYIYSSTEQQLESHLELLIRLADGVCGNASEARVTFDDGHASQFRYAFPLLQKHGVRAIFFAIAGWMGQRPDYMTWPQLRELASAGHEIQSHGLTHRFLTQCTDSELREEVQVARTELQQRLGAGVDAISIPFGRWNQRVLRACAAAGYTRIYTSDPKLPFRFSPEVEVRGRFMVKRSTTASDLERILTAGRGSLWFMNARHQGKLLLRAAIGDRTYHRLWGIWGSRKALEEDARKEF